MTTLKLQSVGEATGIVLPAELLNRLHLQAGDVVTVVETANGIEIAPYDAQLTLAEEIMEEDRDVLRRLAE